MYPRLLHLVFLFPLLASAAVPGHYIVEMAGDPAAEGIRSQSMQQRRTQVRAQQRLMRTRVEAAEAEILDSVDTVANAFIVRIPDEKAAQLASIPGVIRVHPVRRFKLNLDHALPMHRVPEAWQQVGMANAGAGMKIAIIDTGVDIQHPGFQDPTLPVPAGFPRANNPADLAFTNNKVIVARSYASLFQTTESDASPSDRVGHGTATAMAAAGVTNTGPLATISGVAPKAYLGSYKVFGSPGINEAATDAAILKAIDDAVSDGMDVINLSLGSIEASRLEDDIEVRALERAAALGILVVVAAGNDGPDPNTIGSPGTAPSVITVGASKNDRVFSASATVGGATPVQAVPGAGAISRTPVTGLLAPVAAIDQNGGLACLPLPIGSLQGRIALIFRGECTFEEKLNNAQRAGAIAALIYTQETQPDPITMSLGAATLPASMIGYTAGIDILQRLRQNPSLSATLTFTVGPVLAGADGLVGFSSRGPSVDLSMKPDLAAVGTNFYTAAQKLDSRGALYNANGYTLTQGTSFSSPLLAGAAAVLKAARPGLTAAQYRSLLINTAGAWSGTAQETGAGILNLSAALRGTAVAFPTSISFQAGDASPNVSRSLTISNVGRVPAVFRLEPAPGSGGPAPSLSVDSVRLNPGASAQILVNLTASSLQPGQYEGVIRVADTTAGLEMHVPYWYAVPSGTAKFITLLDVKRNGRPFQSVRDAVLFRVTDASGLALTNIEPVVTVSGDGELTSVSSRDRFVPGAFGITLRLGSRRGGNVIKIQVGDVVKEVTI